MIVFHTPVWLIALLLLPVAWLQWTRFGHGVPHRLRVKVASLRSLVLTLLILALAGPHWTGGRQGTDVLLLVDASDSMVVPIEALVSEYTAELEGMLGPRDRLGVILFGQDTLVHRSLGEPSDGRVIFLPDSNGTNLERALRVSTSLSPPERSARILLVSDGRETVGSAREIANDLGAAGIPVDVLPTGHLPPTELFVDSFILPTQVSEGEPFTARAVITSTGATQARAYLFRNGVLIDERDVEIAAGRNLVEYSNLTQQIGVATYELRVETSLDTFAQNNVGHAVVTTSEELRVLLVAGITAESAPLHASLLAQNIPVDFVPASESSWDASTLAGYATVLLHNVPANQLATRQLTELEYYVRQMGGGLVLIGGNRSFGLGGYGETLLEDISPLQVRAPEHALMPSVAMVLVIDKSGSMNEQAGTGTATKLDLAKEAVLGVAGFLDVRDVLGIVAFDSRAEWVVPLSPAGERELMTAQVLRLRADGGTNIYVGVEAAAEGLSQVEAGVKHVILLSDGHTTAGGFESLISGMRSQGITVSTVGVGDADIALLQNIAQWGGGRHYYTDDAYRIPYIFASETRMVSPLPFEEGRVEPIVVEGSESLFDLPHLPPLDGYLVTHAKEQATVHVVAGDDVPLLGSWRYGLGRVVSFTSALSPEWAAEWLAWEGLAPLWAQITRWSMRPPLSETIQASMEVRGGVGRIWVDALTETGAYVNHLQLVADLRAADGSSTTLELRQVGPGRYEATFPAAATGTWTASIQDDTGALPHPLVTSAAVPFPEEYRFLGPDLDLLATLASLTGGQVVSSISDFPAVLAETTAVAATQPLWQWIVLAGLFVFMFDLGVRYVPKGTLAYTWNSLRARRSKGVAKVRARLQQETLTRHIQTTRERERTAAPIDSRQRASRQAHTELARLKKDRRTSKEDSSKSVDS